MPQNTITRLKIFEFFSLGFPGGSAGKESACNAGNLGWEDPLEKGMATSLQYSGLENSMAME